MLIHSVFNPKSPGALAISNLFIITIVVSGLIVLGITAVLVYTMIRFHHRPGEPDPPPTFGIPKLEIAWTVTPFLLSVCIFVGVLITMQLAAPTGDPPVNLEVIGHQWWWELRYPSGVVTANEIHLPVGRRFYVALKSADVIHSLWVPQLGAKMDLVPGQTNYMYLEADQAGTYEGACAEFCGPGHAWMLLRVVAQPLPQFQAWEKQQLRNAAPPKTAEEALGRALFTQFTCESCHAIFTSTADRIAAAGQPADAPNLTHVASRQTLASGRLANSFAAMIAWLHNPDQVKEGANMPNFQLSPAQLKALATYLESLR